MERAIRFPAQEQRTAHSMVHLMLQQILSTGVSIGMMSVSTKVRELKMVLEGSVGAAVVTLT
jgi:hypothetical protein